MGNGNGKWATSVWVTLLIAVVGGAFSLGLHVGNENIHESHETKEIRIHQVIDREVTPQLERMQIQLDRIERKIDNGNHPPLP